MAHNIKNMRQYVSNFHEWMFLFEWKLSEIWKESFVFVCLNDRGFSSIIYSPIRKNIFNN